MQLENERLRGKVEALKQELARLTSGGEAGASASGSCPIRKGPPPTFAAHSLNKDQVQRYSRHLVLPSFGLEHGGIAQHRIGRRFKRPAWIGLRPPHR